MMHLSAPGHTDTQCAEEESVSCHSEPEGEKTVRNIIMTVSPDIISVNAVYTIVLMLFLYSSTSAYYYCKFRLIFPHSSSSTPLVNLPKKPHY